MHFHIIVIYHNICLIINLIQEIGWSIIICMMYFVFVSDRIMEKTWFYNGNVQGIIFSVILFKIFILMYINILSKIPLSMGSLFHTFRKGTMHLRGQTARSISQSNFLLSKSHTIHLVSLGNNCPILCISFLIVTVFFLYIR